MPRWLLALLAFLVAILWWVGHRGSASLAASTDGNAVLRICQAAPSPPDGMQTLQLDAGGQVLPFRMGQATISPLAGFSLQARVLSRENYSMGRESDYSPTDLALGWGPMAAPGMADRLHVSQGGRWYRYRWDDDGPPLPVGTIVRSSANMHMVPANADVARALSAISDEDVIRLRGWLVRIDGDSGWHWQSSLSRDDSGSGACELVLVCSIEKR